MLKEEDALGVTWAAVIITQASAVWGAWDKPQTPLQWSLTWKCFPG